MESDKQQAAITRVKAQADARGAVLLSESDTECIGTSPARHLLRYEMHDPAGKSIRVCFGVTADGKIDRSVL